ncbi:MAG: hypothetical protein GY698_24080 [Actinomycetia bacterium]|nr:hypothetical protein [Actinomycetes bacterium]
MFRILYRFLSALAGLAVRSGRSKDLEIIVLRHQLTVLGRQTERPAIDDNDRTVLGAIAAALPRRLRRGWIVTPESLLRWHRRRIARHWTQTSRPTGRPPTSAKVASLAIGMASDKPDLGLPTYHRRAQPARPPHRRLDGVEDPQAARHRPCPEPLGGDLDRVPSLPSRCRM